MLAYFWNNRSMLNVISIMRIIGQLLSEMEGLCVKLTFLTGQMYTEMSFYHKDRQLLPNITPLTVDGQTCLAHDYRLLRPLIATDEMTRASSRNVGKTSSISSRSRRTFHHFICIYN